MTSHAFRSFLKSSKLVRFPIGRDFPLRPLGTGLARTHLAALQAAGQLAFKLPAVVRKELFGIRGSSQKPHSQARAGGRMCLKRKPTEKTPCETGSGTRTRLRRLPSGMCSRGFQARTLRAPTETGFGFLRFPCAASGAVPSPTGRCSWGCRCSWGKRTSRQPLLDTLDSRKPF